MDAADNWSIELARQHVPEGGEARLYGVIIFTARHVHIRKMLDDDAYWRGLDEVVGLRWHVFATRAAEGRSKVPDRPDGTSFPLHPVWDEPDANIPLLDAFQIDSTRSLPALVIFAEEPDGTALNTVVPIDGDSPAAAFKSLLEILDVVARSLDGMSDHFRRIDQRAYQVVSSAVQSALVWRKTKKLLSLFFWLRSQV